MAKKMKRTTSVKIKESLEELSMLLILVPYTFLYKILVKHYGSIEIFERSGLIFYTIMSVLIWSYFGALRLSTSERIKELAGILIGILVILMLVNLYFL